MGDEFVSLEHLLLVFTSLSLTVSTICLMPDDREVVVVVVVVVAETGCHQWTSQRRKGHFTIQRRYIPESGEICRQLKTRRHVTGTSTRLSGATRRFAVLQNIKSTHQEQPHITGEPGTGKTAIVEGIGASYLYGVMCPRIRRTNRFTHWIWERSLPVPNTKESLEERLKSVINEVIKSDGEHHSLHRRDPTHCWSRKGEGAMDAANILKPALHEELRPLVQIHTDEYQKYFERIRKRRFQIVQVNEPDTLSTVSILRDWRSVMKITTRFVSKMMRLLLPLN